MSLAQGTKLGPYEILAPIGAGGMGEVYKATDTRLNRTVAIKILPPHVSGIDEMKARFDREAQTIASLNHPNICTLHDVGHDADHNFLVLEYLEGETLSQRLTRGSMPLAEALTVGIAIADALDKAHRQGVVHRDLKPANVMLTKAGPKLLDFGLAKWTTGDADTIAAMPTRADVTAKGTMLGTLQYMAPEQIEGREADRRTDIFGFGTLIYEMVTGKRAFEGKSQATLISAIMSRDPKPMSLLVPVSPPALEHVVERCLAKEPDDRWQSAHSLLIQLRWIAYGDSRSGAGPVDSADERKRRRLAVLVPGLAMLLAGVIAIPAYLSSQTPDSGEPFSFRVPLRGLEDSAIAPDGSGIVFVARPQSTGGAALYFRPAGALTATRLEGTADATQPFFSHDSKTVAFVAGTTLRKTPVTGGQVKTLGQVPEFKGGTWSQHNVILFGSSKGIFRISGEGGSVSAVTTAEAPATGHYWPRFLPDGSRYIFLAWADKAPERALFAGQLESADRTRVMALESQAIWAPSARSETGGFLVYHRDDGIFAHPFDPEALTLAGQPSQIAGGARADSGTGLGAFDVSQTGVLAYYSVGRGGRGRGGENPAGQFGWMHKSGRPLLSVGEPGPWGDIDLSPDGTQIALTRMDGGGDIWVLDWERGAQGTRLTLDPANDVNPVWSHDGRRIAFTSYRNGNADILIRNANGVGEEEPLLASPKYESIEDWARDGSHIAYLFGEESNPDIWAMPLTGEKKPFAIVEGPFLKNEPQFSYDARWLAYTTNESGEYEVYVMSFPDGKQRKKASIGGGGQPRWSPDGKELYYRGPAGRAMVVTVTTKPELAVATPRLMYTMSFQPGYTNAPTRHQWSMHPDGQRFLQRLPPTGGSTGGVPAAPAVFSPPGTGLNSVAPATTAPIPNFGLTLMLDWPATLKKGEK